jgi:c(7)-type cytochrome triheme protein
MTGRSVRVLVVAAVLALAGAAAAELPRLPKDLALARGPDSPGQVVFRHESHVDSDKPNCVACHPRRFSILGRSAEAPRAPQVHAAMEKGQGCGGCHGQAAFGFEECDNCHAK